MKAYDEWIIGEGLESPGRWYVLHTVAPMFLAEICDEDDDWLDGLTWSLANGQVATRITFYDDPPTGEALDAMIFKLSEVLDDYDERVDRRVARGEEPAEED